MNVTLVDDVHSTARVIVDPDIDDDKRCAMCRRHSNVFVVEKHHIWPKGWGGPPTEAESARWDVWVYADGNCHNTVHLILDHMKRVGEWDEGYLEHWDFPYGPFKYAKLGWDKYIAHLEAQESTAE